MIEQRREHLLAEVVKGTIFIDGVKEKPAA